MNQKKTYKGTWKFVDKKSKENKHKLWAYSKEDKY
jgi:hypothetical protein